MQYITKIFVHHSGGIFANPYHSKALETPHTIDTAHKHRWARFKDSWPAYKSSMGYYGGYNIVFPRHGPDPFFQFRALGEETAAARGYNFNSLHFCFIANNTIDPKTGKPVDDINPYQMANFLEVVTAILEGDAEQMGIVVAPNAVLQLNMARIYPHRWAGPTKCYGNGWTDNHARDMIMEHYFEQMGEWSKLLRRLYLILSDKNTKRKFGKMMARVGAPDGDYERG